MWGYKHLTWNDRLTIDKMKRAGAKQCEIAARLHVSEATISRELRRATYVHTNSDLTTEVRYNPEGAQRRYDFNKTAKGAPLKIGNDHKLAAFLEKMIAKEKYSPCAALAVIRNNPDLYFKVTICRKTLYSYIDRGVFLHITNKDLPFKGKRRKSKTKRVRAAKVPRGESIEKRPENINNRTEFGHWEMDLVESCRKGESYLMALTERQTRQEIVVKIPNKQAKTVVKALDRIEIKYGELFKSVFKSITVDNGTEFSDCVGLERSVFDGWRTKLYYCHPYSSYERGSNEKQNQMLRRPFPKGTNFNTVSDEEVERGTNWLNNYPRLKLGWGTSADLFDTAISSIVAAR